MAESVGPQGRAMGTDVSVSLRMLVLIRWVAVIGQAGTLLVVRYGFGFDLPVGGALAVVSASVALNLLAMRPRPTPARAATCTA